MLSGLLLALTYEPFGQTWLAWFALIPYLYSIYKKPDPRKDFFKGFLLGLILFMIALRPLVSAHLWTGWSTSSTEELSFLETRQFIVLNLLAGLISAWCGVFWGAASAILSYLVRGSLVRLAVYAPAVLVLVTEWLRSVFNWHYNWMFIGDTIIDIPSLLQLAAYGGIWLLSWLVIAVNAGLLSVILLLRKRQRGRQWLVPAAIAVAITAVHLSGVAHIAFINSQGKSSEPLDVAALQYHQQRYGFKDFMAIGLERPYMVLTQQIVTGAPKPVDLLVLPESVAYTVISLDGSRSEHIDEDFYRPLSEWERLYQQLLQNNERDLAIISGHETVQKSKVYNSMLFWTRNGLQGKYDKQRLVPFAEYQPTILGLLGLSGSSFSAGESSQITEIHDIRIGALVCQEVLMPAVTRASVIAGAQLLVSGGNDGVFADPAAARIHANIARVRAVETGRYMVRSMKSGISAIIAPSGEEIARSPSSAPIVITGQVYASDYQTFYVKYGNWPVLLALLLLAFGVYRGRKRTRA